MGVSSPKAWCGKGTQLLKSVHSNPFSFYPLSHLELLPCASWNTNCFASLFSLLPTLILAFLGVLNQLSLQIRKKCSFQEDTNLTWWGQGWRARFYILQAFIPACVIQSGHGHHRPMCCYFILVSFYLLTKSLCKSLNVRYSLPPLEEAKLHIFISSAIITGNNIFKKLK